MRSAVVPIALVAALLGGAGAVAAEVVFTRKLALLFGVTAPAAATVVAVYMGGMAIGSALGGRLADRLGARVVPLYVGLELLGAAWAASFAWLFALASDASVWLSAEHTLALSAVATAVLVGPAAVASGATFPSLARLVGQDHRVRQLYAANAGGAAGGGLVAGLYLPGWLGLSGTLWAASGSMAAAGLLVLALGLGRAPAEVSVQPEPKEPVSPGTALAAYAAIGGLGMGAEIGWTRLIEQSGPNPGSLAFPIVLATYLAGLSLGGLLLEPRLRHRGERQALAICAALAGGATLLVVATLPLIPEERIIGHLVGAGPGNEWLFDRTGVQISVDRLALYLAAVFLPGLAAGAGFPIAASAMTRARGALGRGVGLTGAAGVGAAVVVSLWMGFLPSWGPGSVHLTVALGVAALGVSALVARSRVLAGLAGAGCAGFLLEPWAGLQIQPREEVLAFVETAAGPSAVARGDFGGRTITSVYTHGERVAGMKLDLEYPLLFHPDPARMLVIAFGTGINIRGVLRDPAVTELTCVDIDPALPELAEHVPEVGAGLFDGQRSHFVVDDGRHLLRQADRDWEVIYSDVATYAQYVELGTVEFFELVRSRLAPGGVFALKLHPDTLSREGLARFLATYLEVFPESALFAEGTPVPVLLGFTDGFPDADALRTRVGTTGGVYGQGQPAASLRHLVLGPDQLAALADGEPATDDRPLELRRALVGPVTEQRLADSALPWLVQHGVRVRPELPQLFDGLQVRTRPWQPRGRPVGPRRGWFEDDEGSEHAGAPRGGPSRTRRRR